MTTARREPAFLGMPPFPKAAHDALADTAMGDNLREETRAFRSRRAEVVDELPPFVWEKLRLAGAAIKDGVLAQLPRHLDALEASVTAAGGTVHWARDADEANAVIVGIAREHAAAQVVTTASTTTREIGLTEALAKAGIRAWETDPAQSATQSGRQPRAHTVVPAVRRHRTGPRGRLARKTAAAGASDTRPVRPTGTEKATRRDLRDVIAHVKVAVARADFAIAETGTVCAAESAAGGRLCSALPDALVTVLGIEQVIPTWRDAEVFLQLLPRSTGERMAAYTSMWTGVTSGDGPRSFHLVLLDNGRSDVLADPVGRQALRCIGCSACLPVCPVYERVGGQPYGSAHTGPIGAILTPQLRGLNRHSVDPQTASLPYASTLCGACFDVCPVRIDIPGVLTHQRAQLTDLGRGPARRGEKAAMKAAGWGFAEPWRLGLAQHAAALGRRVVGRSGRIGRVPRLLAGPLAAWTADRDAPAPPPESFRAWFKRTNGGLDEGASGDQSESPREES
ncbi:LUD domain-containing protein [Yinghuangia sp. YIM S10712]|uniref:LUD domain-containing protein n=1 Tax=Yinghuangia sp. YIM S10712 TaxID=3436930 RepID=UPI003F536B12